MEESKLQYIRRIAIALKLPSPYIYQVNPRFHLIESWSDIVTFTLKHNVSIRPLGCYQSSTSVTIFVFECILDTNATQYKWKIYRRYTHFARYANYENDVNSPLRLPKLTGDIFEYSHSSICRKRAQLLAQWLTRVIQLTKKECANHYSAANESTQASFHSVHAYLLTLFLFSAANTPVSSHVPSLPTFAISLVEIHVQVNSPPLYPSKVRSACSGRFGLGVRFTAASYDKDIGAYKGAILSEFLYERKDLVPDLALVPFGSCLTAINGNNVVSEKFDKILEILGLSVMPLRLCFVHYPGVWGGDKGYTAPLHVNSDGREQLSEEWNEKVVVAVKNVKNESAWGVLGAVFNDVLHRRRSRVKSSVKQIRTWNDLGKSRIVCSKGFLTLLDYGFGHTQQRTKFEDIDAMYKSSQMDLRKGNVIWSTLAGPLSIAFVPCRIQHLQAVMLNATPASFTSRMDQVTSELKLSRGYVLCSINRIDTFGMSYPKVMQMLRVASRPTSLCFRWLEEHSPALEAKTMNMYSHNFHLESTVDILLHAHKDITSNLLAALEENGNVRSALNIQQQANLQVKASFSQIQHSQNKLQKEYMQATANIHRLRQTMRECQRQIQTLSQRVIETEKERDLSLQNHKATRVKAFKDAQRYIAIHESKLIQESNKSIQVLERLLQERSDKEKHNALRNLKSQHEEYLQRLAEEHSEELESLSQQVSVWRHQVQILTRSERQAFFFNNCKKNTKDHSCLNCVRNRIKFLEQRHCPSQQRAHYLDHDTCDDSTSSSWRDEAESSSVSNDSWRESQDSISKVTWSPYSALWNRVIALVNVGRNR